MSDPSTANISQRDKKLKEEISRLRKKSKENVMKIKCLQNKIRLIMRQKGKGKGNSHETDQGLKRQKSFADDESTDSESSLPSPISFIETIDFDSETDLKIKSEPEDDLAESAIPADMGDIRLDDVKKIEDDPLLMYNGYND